MKWTELISILVLLIIILWMIKKSDSYFKTWQKLLIGGGLSFFTIFELTGLGISPGLFGDEAFNFYNSWTIAHYGVDAHLLHNAVYSISAGGQSVLYEWLCYPFMKLGGANLAAYRFPMAILTVISIVLLVYSLYKNEVNANIITGITLSLTTAEWLLLHAHWAMDCNIVIPIFTLALAFILLGKNGKGYNYIAIILITLMTYCYVGAWIVLPLLYIGIEVYLYKQDRFNKRDILISSVISVILLVPILCYIMVQFMGVKPFKFLWFSVVPLSQTRASDSMIPFNGNMINSMIANVVSGISQVLTGNDGWLQESIPGFAVFYFMMFMIACYGIVKIIKLKDKNNSLIQLISWVSISILPMVLLVEANFTHWSLVLFVLSVWSGIGLGFIFNNSSKKALMAKVAVLFIMILSTINFTTFFFKDFPKTEIVTNQLPGYTINFKDSKLFIEHLNKLHVDKYYGVPIYNQNQPNGNVELLCIEHPSPYKLNQFEEKYQNQLPQNIQDGSAAYIVPKDQVDKYPQFQSLPSKEMQMNYTKYIVYYNKN